MPFRLHGAKLTPFSHTFMNIYNEGRVKYSSFVAFKLKSEMSRG